MNKYLNILIFSISLYAMDLPSSFSLFERLPDDVKLTVLSSLITGWRSLDKNWQLHCAVTQQQAADRIRPFLFTNKKYHGKEFVRRLCDHLHGTFKGAFPFNAWPLFLNTRHSLAIFEEERKKCGSVDDFVQLLFLRLVATATKSQLRSLIAAGASPDQAGFGYAPPLISLVVSNLAIPDIENKITFLMDHGGQINITDQYKRNCLFYIIDQVKDSSRAKKLIELLVSKGIEVQHRDAHGFTPYAYAWVQRRVDVTKALKPYVHPQSYKKCVIS